MAFLGYLDYYFVFLTIIIFFMFWTIQFLTCSVFVFWCATKGCQTVLLPARVVQALNLNFDAVNNGRSQQRFGSGFAQELGKSLFLMDFFWFANSQIYGFLTFGFLFFVFSEAMVARRNALLAQQRPSLRPEGSLNHEVRLPQEWTY